MSMCSCISVRLHYDITTRDVQVTARRRDTLLFLKKFHAKETTDMRKSRYDSAREIMHEKAHRICVTEHASERDGNSPLGVFRDTKKVR